MNEAVQANSGSKSVPNSEEYYTAGNPSRWRLQPITVTGVLITYNQERFVRSAIESVLDQSYPLDIIIADDASQDGTLTVLKSVLRNYSGPHRIRLLQACRNRGICGNQNTALRLAEGELVVLFEGDDVSLPDRVTLLVSAYQEHGRAIGALGSAVYKMNRDGEILGKLTWPVSRGDAALLVAGGWNVVGCGMAIRRDCFFDVGPISDGLISGDIALWMRAAFLRGGGLAFVSRPLVNYRIHGDNTSSKVSLRYHSSAALRACCQRLLRNEVAQVLELKKIARYRRTRQLKDASAEAIWLRAFSIARSRARLVLAIAKHPYRKWFLPAVLALRHRGLRPLAIRALALGLCPFVFDAHNGVRRTGQW